MDMILHLAKIYNTVVVYQVTFVGNPNTFYALHTAGNVLYFTDPINALQRLNYYLMLAMVNDTLSIICFSM